MSNYLNEPLGNNDGVDTQRGDYRFSQEMLRQVAYETLSRRERKEHHLAVEVVPSVVEIEVAVPRLRPASW